MTKAYWAEYPYLWILHQERGFQNYGKKNILSTNLLVIQNRVLCKYPVRFAEYLMIIAMFVLDW